MWYDFIPELFLQGKGRASSHKPAVAQSPLVEVCATQTLDYQVRIVTELLVREGGRGGEGEGGGGGMLKNGR